VILLIACKDCIGAVSIEPIELKEMEIVAFENQSPYDSLYVVNNPIGEFIEMCKRYVNPEYVLEENAEVFFGQTFISYCDRSGGDKPMIVMLMGITSNMIPEIIKALKELYINKCRCGKIIDKKMCVCNECSDKCEGCEKNTGFCEC
jgi:hypothetical protein